MSAEHEVRPFVGFDEFRACVQLQRDTWGADFSELVPVAMLKAAQRTGGIAIGAFDGRGGLDGFVFGITGVVEGRLVHWSDMLAVRSAARNRGLGERLKRRQRDDLLRSGIGTVYWTFDPLESKNAYLNFARLGVLAGEYVRDIYGGHTDSPLHRGIGTDRLIAVWSIDSERVCRRLAGADQAPQTSDVGSLPLVNPTHTGAAGLESADPDLELDADRLRIAIPVDIQAVKDRSIELGAEWRRKTRAAFETYLARGYVAVELVRDAERSTYVLAHGDVSSHATFG